MKKFLRTAFHITWFQVLLIAFFMALKYLVVTFKIDDIVKVPLVWICFVAFLLLLLAYGLIGAIENKGFSYEAREANTERSRKKALLTWFIKWARIVPIALGNVLFAYLLAPESVSMLIALLAGVFVSNVVSFFQKKNRSETVEVK